MDRLITEKWFVKGLSVLSSRFRCISCDITNQIPTFLLFLTLFLSLPTLSLTAKVIQIDRFEAHKHILKNFYIPGQAEHYRREALIAQPPKSQGIVFEHSFNKVEHPLFTTSRVLWDQGVYLEAPLFMGLGSYLILPSQWSDYFKNYNLSSFTIEFSFFPSTSRDEILLEGKETIIQNTSLIPIEFRLGIKEEKLYFEGINFFHFNQQHLSLKLESTSKVDLNQWNKAALSYDRKSGRLELTLSPHQQFIGVSEFVASSTSLASTATAFTYATEDQSPYSKAYYPGFLNQRPPAIVLGVNFVGKIDELKLRNLHLPNPNLEPDKDSVYGSKVFTFAPLTKITKVQLEGENITEQEVSLHLCSKVDYFKEYRRPESCPKIPWLFWKEKSQKKILNHKTVINKNLEIANYYQFFLVYRKVRSAIEDIRINSLILSYDQVSQPHPPKIISVLPRDEGVFITWEKNFDEFIHGYVVYYQEDIFNSPKKNIIFETDQLIPVSKTLEGVFIKGLSPNQIYHFGIKSFTRTENGVLDSNFAQTEPIYLTSKFFK